MAAIDMLRLGVECYLQNLTDAEFEDLVKVVRPPATSRHPAERKPQSHNTVSAQPTEVVR